MAAQAQPVVQIGKFKLGKKSVYLVRLLLIGLLAWIAVRANRGEFNSSYYTPVDLVGLYWHLVDLIWIYLFPLYYLIS